MGKDKLKRFAENETFGNVYDKRHELPGKWHAEVFKNNHPIVLELGCGRGEYTVNLARLMPERNFLGIDVKGARLWRGAKTAVEEKLANTAFLRIRIETIGDFFAPGEVDEIWITFPDPQPQIGRAKKRLTSPRFLNEYHRILKPGGLVHLKTDNAGLYEFTLEMAERYKLQVHFCTDNLYDSRKSIVDSRKSGPPVSEILSIRTTYEARYLEEGKPIHYLSFSFPGDYRPVDWKQEMQHWKSEKLSTTAQKVLPSAG